MPPVEIELTTLRPFFSEYMQNIVCLNSNEVGEWEESCVETMQETVSENSTNTCRSLSYDSWKLRTGEKLNCYQFEDPGLPKGGANP